MGTRFVCAKECTVHPNYKKAIISARDRSTVVTGRSTGHPVRVLSNKLAKQFLEAEAKGLSPREIEAIGAGALRRAVVDGDVEYGSLMAGQVSAMVRKEESCKAIIDDVISGAEKVLERLCSMQKCPESE